MASTPRFDFAVYGLIDDHPEYQHGDMDWTSFHVNFWYGSPIDEVGPGVLVRSYDPGSLIRDRDDEAPWNSSGIGPYPDHSLWSIRNQALRELANIAELKDAMRHKGDPVMRDTLMLIDGARVPAVTWDVHGLTVGGSVTASVSLLTHPVAVTTWRDGLPSPIRLETLTFVSYTSDAASG